MAAAWRKQPIRPIFAWYLQRSKKLYCRTPWEIRGFSSFANHLVAAVHRETTPPVVSHRHPFYRSSIFFPHLFASLPLLFLLSVFKFGIGVWGAIFPTDQYSRRWVGSSSLDIRGMVLFHYSHLSFHFQEIWRQSILGGYSICIGWISFFFFVHVLLRSSGLLSWFSSISNFYLRKSCWPMQHNLHVPWETAFWYPYSFYRVVFVFIFLDDCLFF